MRQKLVGNPVQGHLVEFTSAIILSSNIFFIWYELPLSCSVCDFKRKCLFAALLVAHCHDLQATCVVVVTFYEWEKKLTHLLFAVSVRTPVQAWTSWDCSDWVSSRIKSVDSEWLCRRLQFYRSWIATFLFVDYSEAVAYLKTYSKRT